jgi:gliding motility-associated-like protein
VDVVSGSTVGEPPANPGPITGNQTVCQNTTTSYNLAPVTGATQYQWTLSPPIGTVAPSNNNNATVTWNTPGTTQLCVTVSNVCFANPNPSCIDIEVLPPPTATLSGSGLICSGGGGTVDLSVAFTGGDGPWTFVYQINGVNQAPITTSSNPYTLTVNQTANYTLSSVTYPNSNCVGTVSGSGSVSQASIALTGTPTAETCGQGNGAINITATPPNGTSFEWSNGSTSEDLTNIGAGTYTVTVTNTQGCTATGSFTVQDNITNPNITGTVTANTACSTDNGAIDISVSPNNNYNYTWSNGATTQDISNLAPGSYSVTVSFGTTCSATANFTVPDLPNNPNASLNPTESTCELSNGSVNLSVSGGVSPYTFSWSNGATTEDLANIPSGQYTVTVTGANGCTDTETTNVNNNNPPISVTSTIINNTTCNGGNGSINITVSPATPTGGGSYTFNWSNGATTEDISNLEEGTYTVTVTGNGACNTSQNFNITAIPNNPSAATSTTPSSCNLANGDINLTPSGGVAPYSFSWSNGATTEDLNDVLSGNYTVTVTGANGCTATASADLQNNDPTITITPTISANTACSSNNGSISISVSPASNYTITWSNGSNGPTITGLEDGSYSVTVDGGGSCTQTASFTVPFQPNSPTPTVTTTPTTCELSNGSANANATGGVAPYTFEWSNGASGPSIINVPSGGYVVTVTGANGCSSLVTADIPNNNLNINLTPNITPNTTCAATGNGSISVAISPPASYTITWSTGATNTSVQNNLAPGTYSVTVSAGGVCEEVGTYTVPDEPNEPTVVVTPDNANCGLPNGSATVSGSGGTTPYTYAWSNGSTGTAINNVLSGNYTVTVTSANQCTGSASVDILDDDIPINVSETTVDNTSCILPNNGAISIVVSPPTASITWSNGSTSTSLDNLVPGNYSVTVSAGGTCTFVGNYTIFNSSENATIENTVTPSFCGQANGGVDVTAANGQGPYEYNWSNGWPLEDLFDAPPGNYTVTVTTATGCTTTASMTVPNNNATINLNGTTTPVNSCSVNNGGITLAPSPAANYTFLWSNGATTQNLTNIATGNYTVTVSNGPSCSSTATFQVTNTASPPTLSTSPTAATCGLTNGAVNLTVTGGTTPYTINWSNSATTEDLASIAEGTYTVTVTGGNGCSATASANVGNTNTAPNITGTPTANSSCIANNGGVNLSVTPSGTYTYTWSNSATTEDITNVAAGTYTVTVSAGGSCSATSSFTVANDVSSPNLVESITPAICSQSNGGINLTVTGATTPYIFAWSNPANTEDISNVLPGNYSVTVTGANGCSSTATYNVPNNSNSFSLSAVEQPLSSCASNNGSVNLTITPSGNYSIQWSNSATTEDISNLAPGSYSVTVTESGSCSATASYVVEDITESPTLGQNITAEVCGLVNGAINLSVSGSTTPYSFAWSNSASTEDLSNIAEGTYTVTVTGANGCSATTSANVPGNTIAFSINGITAPNTSCDINNGGINLTISPFGTYTYQWSTNAATEDLNGLTGGTYAVTVSAGGNCTATADFTVGSTTLDPVISSDITPAECGVGVGTINLSISGGVAPFSFDWAGGQTSEDLSNLLPGSYSVEVEGANGCVSTANFTVQDNSIPLSVSGTPVANSSCDNPNGSINLNVTPAGSYDFIWSNSQTVEDLTGLPPGTYNVTVTEGLNCTAEANFTVGNNTNAPNFSQTVDPATCGLANGGINLNASGGSQPYSYQWSNGAITEDLSGVAPGNYQVTITGSDGCANTGDIEVTDVLLPLSASSTPSANTNCTGGNGSINLTVSPGGTYTYAWSTSENTEDLNGLPGGTYTVTISAGGSCTTTASVVVPDQPDEPSLTNLVAPSICGAPDGSVNISVTGGAMPYNFEWSNGAMTEDVIGVISGDYLVTVTAANGCTATGSYFVPSESNTFSFTGSPSPNTLCGSDNGSINLTVTPVGVYSFNWSNGQTTEDISSLAPGMYEVTVSDAGSCTATQQFTVGNNAPTVNLTGVPVDVLCLGGNNGSINLSPSGGVAPYVFEWSPNIPGSPEDPTGLVAGTYAVTVTDASGCKGTASFDIGEPATATQLLCTQSENVSLPGQTDGEGTVTISGGTAPYAVDWNPGGQQVNVSAGNFVIGNLGLGNYAVTVTDANGCIETCGFNVTTDDCITAIGTMSNSLLTACGEDCITATYSAIGSYLDANDVLQFVLHTGTGNQIVNEILRSDQPSFCFTDANLTYGVTYYISAVAGDPDANGNVILTDACTQVSLGTPIVFHEIPVASIAQPDPLTCVQSQVQVQGSSSLSGSTYAWSTQGGSILGSSTTQNIQVNAPGTYTLIVSNNGCQSTASVQVTSIGTIVTANIISSPGEILDCVVSQITLTATYTGTSNPTFSWTQNGQQIGTAPTYPVSSGGTYQVLVTDPASGCTGTASVTISDNTDYPAVQVNPAPLMNCQDTVVTISGSSPVNGVTFQWASIVGTDTTIIGTGTSTQVNEPGTYYLIGTAPNGCQNGEAVEVIGDFATPTANAGQDQVLDCYETPLDLTGSGVGVSFFWTTNLPGVTISDPTSPVITVNADGIYTLTVTSLGNHCTDSDDVEVFQYENVPQAEVIAEDPDCVGDTNGSIELNTDPANGPYTFNFNGQDYGGQNVFAPLAPGVYEIEVTDGQGCVWTTEVTIYEPEELVVNLGADLLIELGQTATIIAQYTVPASQLDTMIWTPADQLPCPQMPCDVQEFAPTQQTVVTLTIIDENGCTADDLLTVFVEKDNPIYVPSGFSPNGDGTNDVFMIFSGPEVQKINSFLVFDRWGEAVFEYFDFVPNNPAYGWDGRWRGQIMNPAVFAWFAEVEFKDGTVELFKGDVTLVR